MSFEEKMLLAIWTYLVTHASAWAAQGFEVLAR